MWRVGGRACGLARLCSPNTAVPWQEQLWISTTELAAGVGQNSAKAKAMANNEDVSRLYSFPASVAGTSTTHLFTQLSL